MRLHPVSDANSSTENDVLGISRNPWDPDRTPGGSSSGAGAAVAAGMAPIAHSEDGGGSIRIPASCTGLVGLEPTRGLVTNLTVEVEGLATSGVVTRTVADGAAALDVLARHDPGAWWSPPAPRTPFAALRERARAIDSWTYVGAVRRTELLSRRIVEGFLAHFDLLVTPTMACQPPTAGPRATRCWPLRAGGP